MSSKPPEFSLKHLIGDIVPFQPARTIPRFRADLTAGTDAFVHMSAQSRRMTAWTVDVSYRDAHADADDRTIRHRNKRAGTDFVYAVNGARSRQTVAEQAWTTPDMPVLFERVVIPKALEERLTSVIKSGPSKGVLSGYRTMLETLLRFGADIPIAERDEARKSIAIHLIEDACMDISSASRKAMVAEWERRGFEGIPGWTRRGLASYLNRFFPEDRLMPEKRKRPATSVASAAVPVVITDAAPVVHADIDWSSVRNAFRRYTGVFTESGGLPQMPIAVKLHNEMIAQNIMRKSNERSKPAPSHRKERAETRRRRWMEMERAIAEFFAVVDTAALEVAQQMRDAVALREIRRFARSFDRRQYRVRVERRLNEAAYDVPLEVRTAVGSVFQDVRHSPVSEGDFARILSAFLAHDPQDVLNNEWRIRMARDPFNHAHMTGYIEDMLVSFIIDCKRAGLPLVENIWHVPLPYLAGLWRKTGFIGVERFGIQLPKKSESI